MLSLIDCLNHAPTHVCVLAERAMNATLEGGCQFPIAAYAQRDNGVLTLRGRVGSVDGKKVVNTEVRGDPEQPLLLGERAAQNLLAEGAREGARWGSVQLRASTPGGLTAIA